MGPLRQKPLWKPLMVMCVVFGIICEGMCAAEAMFCESKDKFKHPLTLQSGYLAEKDCDLTFGTKSWREDTVLIVEGKRLYVSSSILSLVSPVFTKMIEGHLCDDQPLEIELKEKKYDDVLEFLKCLYPNIMKKVTMNNVFVLLPLAKEFGVEQMTRQCESMILENIKDDTPIEDICMYLNKAIAYNLHTLGIACVAKASMEKYRDFEEAEKKYPLPYDVKNVILGIMIQSLDSKLPALQEKVETYSQYEKILRSANLMELLFGGVLPSTMKNSRVGYLELVFKPQRNMNVQSQQVLVHGMYWSIAVRNTRGINGLSVFINVGQFDSYKTWKCNVSAHFRLRNYNDDNKALTKTADSFFSNSDLGWGFEEFVPMNTVMDTISGFIKDGKARLEIYFIVDEPTFE